MLNRADLDFRGRRVLVFHGKGGKYREVPLHPQAAQAVRAYLATRTDDLPPLFISRQHNRLSLKTIWHILERYTSQLDLGKRIRVHSLRHTAATALKHASGNDPQAVQRFLGHSSINTTMRYWHLDDDELSDAVFRM
jgi:site-specific recombinase XerD